MIVPPIPIVPNMISGVAATSASAKPPRCYIALMSGSGADCGLRPGNSGSVGTSGLGNFANGTLALAWLLKQRAALMALGDLPIAVLLRSRSPIPTSILSAFLDWLARASSTRRTAVYGPVCPVVSQGKRVTAYLCKFPAGGRFQGQVVLKAGRKPSLWALYWVVNSPSGVFPYKSSPEQ